MSHVLFEVSWEVANRVGGLHTVLVGKAPTMTARHGDDYILIGPLLGDDRPDSTPFEAESGFEEFKASCREAGVEVRVGRWLIPGRPRTILVGFSGLFEERDAILTSIWERFAVDSLLGGWGYVEPVLFAHAAGIAIDRWWHEDVAPRRLPAVAQFHDWTAAAGLLHVKQNLPGVGTVFTSHSTALGRAMAAAGVAPLADIEDAAPDELAQTYEVRSRHSIEGAAIREADVFTSVSHLTAEEAFRFHGRRATPLLPGGLDLDLLSERAGAAPFGEVGKRLRRVAWAVTGEVQDNPLLIAQVSRYEVHPKGLDLLLQALARLAERAGPPVLVFLFVPAETTGLRRDLRDRLELEETEVLPPLGLSTHDLIEAEQDPLRRIAESLGLTNAHGSRVKVIHVAAFPDVDDGLLNLPQETVLKGLDLGCHAAFYESWGYLPAECIAVGVPTVTSDCTGFGQWAKEQGLGDSDGVHVLARAGRSDEDAAEDLAALIEARTASTPDRQRIVQACRDAAAGLAWPDVVGHYEEAFALALEVARGRHTLAPLDPHRRRLPLTPHPPQESHRPHLVPFSVKSQIPAGLADLERLAANLWWTWHPDAVALLREVDPPLFDRLGQNPVAMLARVGPKRFDRLSGDEDYLSRLRDVAARFDAYIAERSEQMDLGGGGVVDRAHPVTYFCFEYALHPSLHGYAGGLGVLAGDHLKSASDLNLPFVAVGLFYRGGYAEQGLGPHGNATSTEARDVPSELPLQLVRGEDQEPVQVHVGLPDRRVTLQAWRLDVGRVPLYLLDADLPENREEDRRLTRRLYGGGREMRLAQEILLGKGGMRLLAKLGIEPALLHLNEGHAGFAPLERVAQLVHDHGLAPDEARTVVRATTAFTTHTPVPAGHDVFHEDLIRRYFGQTPAWTGLSWERFLELGRVPGEGGEFNMTYFSMSFASWINGVSQKHGEVSRTLLHPFWPGLLEEEVPVRAITNGVHLPTWTSDDMQRLLVVDGGGRRIGGQDFQQAATVDDAALWDLRLRAKERLVVDLRARLGGASRLRGGGRKRRDRIASSLRPDALYLVFARRFSPYKRPALFLRDRERLVRLLSDEDRPVRLLYAGKAHPRDTLGLETVREVVKASQDDDLFGRLFFVPNYNMALAQTLVEGADVWVNHPVPPLEASGTSGMKAAANGGLNFSILDGWWIEGSDGDNGWGIDGEHAGLDPETRDDLDASALLGLLEEEVVPAFFDRGEDGLPHEWLRRVKHSLVTLPPVFDTDRMVGEYATRAYAPLALSYRRLSAARYATGRALAARHRQLRDGMAAVQVAATRIGDLAEATVGDWVGAEVDLALGNLGPADLVVELVMGRPEERAQAGLKICRLDSRGTSEGGLHLFQGRVQLEEPGPWVYGLRMRPREVAPWDIMLHRLVRWA